MAATREPKPKRTMMNIELLTSDGHPVATIPMPPFQVLPSVVLWGNRFFVRGALVNPATESEDSLRFYETFGWVALV